PGRFGTDVFAVLKVVPPSISDHRRPDPSHAWCRHQPAGTQRVDSPRGSRLARRHRPRSVGDPAEKLQLMRAQLRPPAHVPGLPATPADGENATTHACRSLYSASQISMPRTISPVSP